MSHTEPDVPNPNPEMGQPIDAASLASHYERDDISVRGILGFAGGLFVVLMIVQLLLFWMIRSWTDRPLLIRPQLAPAEVTPVGVRGPGLDAAPELGLDTLLDAEMQRLNGYGWNDRDAGVVRIPIERAMEMLVEEGMPAQEADVPNFTLAPAFRLDSSGGTGMDAVEDGREASEEEAGGEESGSEESDSEESGSEESSNAGNDEAATEGEASDDQ